MRRLWQDPRSDKYGRISQRYWRQYRKLSFGEHPATIGNMMEKRSHVDEVLVEIRILWQAGYSASPDGDVEIKVCSQMRGQASTGDMNPI